MKLANGMQKEHDHFISIGKCLVEVLMIIKLKMHTPLLLSGEHSLHY